MISNLRDLGINLLILPRYDDSFLDYDRNFVPLSFGNFSPSYLNYTKHDPPSKQGEERVRERGNGGGGWLEPNTVRGVGYSRGRRFKDIELSPLSGLRFS